MHDAHHPIQLTANFGWQVINLGAGLPALESSGAARHKRARAADLSLLYSENDAILSGEISLLRETLPKNTTLLVGGRAMPANRETLACLGASPVAAMV